MIAKCRSITPRAQRSSTFALLYRADFQPFDFLCEITSYICQSCGHQEPIKVPVILSRFNFSGGHDGAGGGGG
jgi:hypothetical protein